MRTRTTYPTAAPDARLARAMAYAQLRAHDLDAERTLTGTLHDALALELADARALAHALVPSPAELLRRERPGR